MPYTDADVLRQEGAPSADWSDYPNWPMYGDTPFPAGSETDSRGYLSAAGRAEAPGWGGFAGPAGSPGRECPPRWDRAPSWENSPDWERPPRWDRAPGWENSPHWENSPGADRSPGSDHSASDRSPGSDRAVHWERLSSRPASADDVDSYGLDGWNDPRDHPARTGWLRKRFQPTRADQPGKVARKNTSYLGSAWEYAGARARATAGRHRRRPGRQPTRRRVISLSELRALWAAQRLSQAGDLIAQVAIAIGVYDQTRPPFLTALVYALTYLPPVLGARLLRRLTADRAPRSVMIVLDLVRAGLVASMALAGMPLAGLCVLLLAVMLLGAPFSAAQTALLQNSPPAARRPVSLSSGALSYQASQVLWFLAGAAAVAFLQPRRVLLIDAATFAISAALLTVLVRHRAAGPQDSASGARADGTQPSGTQPSATHAKGTPPDGTGLREATVARTSAAATLLSSPLLRTLLLFGWLAGFYVVPEGLAVPYAHALGGGSLTVGLLMAAMPAGAVAGIITFTRAIRPEARTQLLGWLAMLCCMPLAFSSLRPPLWAVLILWALAGTGAAYQLVVAAAFSRAVRADERPAALGATGALGTAQSGLLAAQALGFVAGGAVAQLIGPQAAVALAGLLGLAVAAAAGRIWERQHDRLAWARRASATIVPDRPAAW